jgi:hypothetical protein
MGNPATFRGSIGGAQAAGDPALREQRIQPTQPCFRQKVSLPQAALDVKNIEDTQPHCWRKFTHGLNVIVAFPVAPHFPRFPPPSSGNESSAEDSTFARQVKLLPFFVILPPNGCEYRS